MRIWKWIESSFQTQVHMVIDGHKDEHEFFLFHTG